MLITDKIFRAFLECETKSYLRLSGDVEPRRELIEWKRRLVGDFKEKCSNRLRSGFREEDYLASADYHEILEGSNHLLVIECLVQAKGLQSNIDALERIITSGKSKRNHFIPIRFVPTQKITKHVKLLLAFDALVLAAASGKMPLFGKIIRGIEKRIVKVPLAGLMKMTEAAVGKIAAQQAASAPPQLVLNKHCAECEFQPRCRQEAIKKDDLTLLSGMTEKERKQLQNKGIFSVTQLSYTFRPRRKPKLSVSKPNKPSLALKALAIREDKVHIAGKPEMNITGTPIYLDVEGIPDRGFYYLVGLRVKSDDSYVQYSFWADEPSQEKKIWADFLQTLRGINNPQLIHYGSYETVFLRRMKERYTQAPENSGFLDQLIAQSVNVLSVIYSRIYFPTYSNGLKDIARHLGFRWSDSTASGFNSIIWRNKWEFFKDSKMKDKLIIYNTEDCKALEKVAGVVSHLCRKNSEATKALDDEIVHADLLKRDYPQRLGKIELAMPELDYINKAAYWDYQRDKIYVRSNQRLQNRSRNRTRTQTGSSELPVNKVAVCSVPSFCQKCNATKINKYGKMSRIVYDLKFGKAGIKRWIIKYSYNRYICWQCHSTFVSWDTAWQKNKFGSELMSFVIYHVIDLKIPQRTVTESISKLFKLPITIAGVGRQKAIAARLYTETYDVILTRIITGELIHADETKANIQGKDAFVWVFTNMEEVAYVYAETRAGDLLRELLIGFKGVLISDFYTAYDSIDCLQQKCLIHLMRDLNDDLLKQPFNEELKGLLNEFAILLKPMVETVDQFGLKSRHLRKHRAFVDRFYKGISKRDYQSEIVLKYKKRFEKNRNKLFTFLDYDGVPWNNNNAEHAIKAFAKLRNVIRGSSTEKGVRDYLTLLSICETCKCKGIDFLDFLRSGAMEIDAVKKAR